jgi:hypothetical protein
MPFCTMEYTLTSSGSVCVPERQPNPPRTDSTANDIAIMMAAINESLTTINTFGRLLQTLTDQVESLTAQVQKQQQSK